MCPNCFSAGFPGFPSYWEFEVFETELQQKLLQQQLLPLPDAVVAAPLRAAPEHLYQCSACAETWAVSTPDNAWRGYFLPLNEALAYRRKLLLRDRARGFVGAALAAGAAALLLGRAFQ